MYIKAGFTNVEGKSGVHHGTFKVFVDFIPVADITDLDASLFENMWEDCIVRDGIRYAPPDYLRMSMYLELSRPRGDVSRWKKVYERLSLFNKLHPLKITTNRCERTEWLRSPDFLTDEENKKIFDVCCSHFRKQKYVFFGGFTSFVALKEKEPINADFEVLVENLDDALKELKKQLTTSFGSVKDFQFNRNNPSGEVVPEYIEIIYKQDSIAKMFKTLACHAYEDVHIKELKQTFRVATFETMMSLYLAFLYASNMARSRNRILCMAAVLFHNKNEKRLKLPSLSSKCYGNQQTKTDIMMEKKLARENLDKADSEYDEYFLFYSGEKKDAKKGAKKEKLTKKGVIKKDKASKNKNKDIDVSHDSGKKTKKTIKRKSKKMPISLSKKRTNNKGFLSNFYL